MSQLMVGGVYWRGKRWHNLVIRAAVILTNMVVIFERPINTAYWLWLGNVSFDEIYNFMTLWLYTFDINTESILTQYKATKMCIFCVYNQYIFILIYNTWFEIIDTNLEFRPLTLLHTLPPESHPYRFCNCKAK